jgi:protein-disulfide isomerase
MDEFKGKVRLVIKTYPYKYRDFAHMAAEAALAAWEQGRFEEMHDTMLKNSPRLDRTSLLGYAAGLGLDMKKFRADLEGMRHLEHIERDKKLAAELDLYNTPSFFINGRRLLGNVPYEYFRKVIEEELETVNKENK